MKHRSKSLLLVNGLALAGSVTWFISQPSWEPAVATLTLVATLVGLVITDRKTQVAESGQGGTAIRTEGASDLHLSNEGIVKAGAGGSGGSGGDAIHVANGVKVTIINRGVIAGGNAGTALPGYEEKWVDFNYPHDSGLQQRLENAGYRIAWCLDTKLSRRIDLEGWEIVTESNANGIPTRYRLRDRPADQTLVMKRNANG